MPAPELSIIMPTLNAGDNLAATLENLHALATQLIAETIVVDGGSHDDSQAIAQTAGARVIETAPGRGGQLAAGARAAEGRWLLFLHADTILAGHWIAAIRTFIGDPAAAQRAAVFRLAFDDDDPRARRVERLANWRSRALGLPYGDQGLLMSRDFYDRLGGFKAMAIMEDVDIARRIGRARLHMLDAEAVTSARRYRRDGWVRRPTRNLFLLALFYAGVKPKTLARFYG